MVINDLGLNLASFESNMSLVLALSPSAKLFFVYL